MIDIKMSIAVISLIGFLASCDPSQVERAVQVPVGTPQTAEDYLAWGDAYASAQRWHEAISYYDQSIQLNPDYAEAYNNRGYAYYWSYDGDKAIADFDRAIALRLDYAYAYNSRGAAYMAGGDSERAIEDFNRALALQPDLAQAYTNRGNAYLKTGQIGRAIADFTHGKKLPILPLVCFAGLLMLMAFAGYRTVGWIRARSVKR